MNLAELAREIDGEPVGDGSAVVEGMAPLEEAGPTEVAFLANPRYNKYMAGARAAGVIVSADYEGGAVPVIRCADPYFAFRQAMVKLYGFHRAPFVGVHRWAYIDERATVGRGVSAAQFVTVCERATVGQGTVLYPGVFIGLGAKIGRDCILHPNVVVYDHCILGDRVTVHANTVIGEDGFGYATHAGAHHKIPQAGSVEIGHDVEIGACCTIDRATIGMTHIEAGTKLSNQVAIGHGTVVGRHNLLVAQVGIAGSTTTGDYCAFAGQAGVVGHLKIGGFVRVGAQAGVSNDVPQHTQVWGTPASPLAEARRQAVLVRKLPKMREDIRQLQRELAELKRDIAHQTEPAERRDADQSPDG